MWGIFFGEFQCLAVDDCPAASCDSGVLTRGSEMVFLDSFPSPDTITSVNTVMFYIAIHKSFC